MEVRDIIPNLNRAVMYGGSEYKLTGSIIRKDAQGQIFYQAELLDKNNNSVCITKLEDVKCLNNI
jgi:hypothetical protein